MRTMTFLTMLFLHVVADYNLQGVLAQMKQRAWWEEYGPLYRQDYLAALLMHSIQWTYLVMLPVAVYLWLTGQDLWGLYGSVFLANTAVHMMVDHLKANAGCLNLAQDQILHLIQLAGTAILFLSG